MNVGAALQQQSCHGALPLGHGRVQRRPAGRVCGIPHRGASIKQQADYTHMALPSRDVDGLKALLEAA